MGVHFYSAKQDQFQGNAKDLAVVSIGTVEDWMTHSGYCLLL